VRRQFREKPGIMDGTEQPDYATCVALVTRAAQREMIIPALIPIVFTIIVGLIDTIGRAFLPDLVRNFVSYSAGSSLGPSLSSMIIYMLMAAVLVFRPEGLFPVASK